VNQFSNPNLWETHFFSSEVETTGGDGGDGGDTQNKALMNSDVGGDRAPAGSGRDFRVSFQQTQHPYVAQASAYAPPLGYVWKFVGLVIGAELTFAIVLATYHAPLDKAD
jgi:hypothetical protein